MCKSTWIMMTNKVRKDCQIECKIHWWANDAMLNFSKSEERWRNKLIYILDGPKVILEKCSEKLVMYFFLYIFILEWTITLTILKYI